MRTYLQMRIGLHAAFNACDEMCERVALERQLPAMNAWHLFNVVSALFTGRDILYAGYHPK